MMREPKIDSDTLRFAADQPSVYDIPDVLRRAAEELDAARDLRSYARELADLLGDARDALRSRGLINPVALLRYIDAALAKNPNPVTQAPGVRRDGAHNTVDVQEAPEGVKGPQPGELTEIPADALLSCPCCGSAAAVRYVDPSEVSESNPNAGAYYIECTEPTCAITTNLRFPSMGDPLPELREVWNRRTADARVAACPHAMVRQEITNVQGLRIDTETRCMACGTLLKSTANVVNQMFTPLGEAVGFGSELPERHPVEEKLRSLLAGAYGVTYGDDGELQNSATHPLIDFRRDSVDELEAKIHERSIRAAAAAYQAHQVGAQRTMTVRLTESERPPLYLNDEEAQ